MTSTYKSLEDFVEEHNRWLSCFGKEPEYSFPLSQDSINKIGNELDCQMSPENLHCDGEISAHQAEKRGVAVMKTVKDLRRYCKDQNFEMPTMYETLGWE